MDITTHISQLPAERRGAIAAMHEVIITNDPNAEPTVGSMMRVEMIIYNHRGFFKYGLANVKDYISLHVLPIYANAPLHEKYKALMPGANFQKGCINFKNIAEIPLDIIGELIKECSPIDLLAIRENQLAAKKKK